MKKINSYIELTRPFTAVFPFLSCFFVGIYSLLYFGDVSIFVVLLSSIALSLTQILGQITNQLSDPPELDFENGKIRPIVRGEINKDEVIILSVVLLFLILLLSSLVGFDFLSMIILLIISITLYNFEPFRLKKRFLLNNLILAFSRGFLPFFIIFHMFLKKINLNELLLLSIGISMWVFIWQTTKDIPDVVGDKKFGIKTIPVVLGYKKTFYFMLFGSVIFFVYIYLVFGNLSLIYIPLIVVGLLCLNEKRKFAIFKENTIAWAIFYLGILVYYVISILYLSKMF